MVYDAWGNFVNHAGATALLRLWIGGLGYYYDPETGLFVAGRRPYGPVIARWLAVDPVRTALVLFGYGYARNTPLNRVDPSGLVSNFASAFQHVPGRGNFTKIVLADMSVPSELSVFFSPNWRPSNAWGSLPPACRCRRVGYAQIVQVSAYYESLIGSIFHPAGNRDWMVDGGIPYPHKGMGGEIIIDPTMTLPELSMQDDPNIGIGNAYLGWLSSYTFDAETCVLCITKPSPSCPPKTEVYGCLRWGWSFYAPVASSLGLLEPTSQFRKYIAIGQISMSTSKRSNTLIFVPVPIAGAPPSDDWYKAVWMGLVAPAPPLDVLD
jgi:RHS repeat-associated protein